MMENGHDTTPGQPEAGLTITCTRWYGTLVNYPPSMAWPLSGLPR